MKNYIPDGWTCTDPGNYQYCQKISDSKFIYRQPAFSTLTVSTDYPLTKEDWETGYLWGTMTIDYNELSDKDISDAISGFYSSLQEVKDLYPNDYKQIVCECYFENFSF